MSQPLPLVINAVQASPFVCISVSSASGSADEKNVSRFHFN